YPLLNKSPAQPAAQKHRVFVIRHSAPKRNHQLMTTQKKFSCGQSLRRPMIERHKHAADRPGSEWLSNLAIKGVNHPDDEKSRVRTRNILTGVAYQAITSDKRRPPHSNVHSAGLPARLTAASMAPPRALDAS
ncbi:hypothetical protein, partial [Caulobacter sp. 602-2]|uniref:hypothetical protein n=1 Tax=Caulobacter sp. 602-2 TaxID=2710887 RepID=UPI00196B6A71